MEMAKRQAGLIFVYLCLGQKSTLVLKQHKTQLCLCKLPCKPVGATSKLFLNSAESDFSEHKLLWCGKPMEDRETFLLLSTFLAIIVPQTQVPWALVCCLIYTNHWDNFFVIEIKNQSKFSFWCFGFVSVDSSPLSAQVPSSQAFPIGWLLLKCCSVTPWSLSEFSKVSWYLEFWSLLCAWVHVSIHVHAHCAYLQNMHLCGMCMEGSLSPILLLWLFFHLL